MSTKSVPGLSRRKGPILNFNCHWIRRIFPRILLDDPDWLVGTGGMRLTDAVLMAVGMLLVQWCQQELSLSHKNEDSLGHCAGPTIVTRHV